MEKLKGHSYSVVTIVLAVILLFLGFEGNFQTTNITVELSSLGGRIVFIILGVTLAALSMVMEFRLARRTKPETKGNQSNASDFLFTIEDGPPVPFPVLVKNAKSVSILARTGVNILNSHTNTIIQLCENGCEVRLLLLDPDAGIQNHIYGDNPEIYKSNIESATIQINKIRMAASGKFFARKTVHAPTFSQLIVEKPNTSENSIRIQIFFLHNAQAISTRPNFSVSYGDRWYELFADEFELIWKNAKEF